MAPKKAKEQTSKKAVQKKKEQSVEDRTFGLKNKNKSKKVQQAIRGIERGVMNTGDPKLRKQEEMRRKAKADSKARNKALKDEQNALFGEALLAVQKKGASSKSGKIDAKGRDGGDDEAANKKTTSRAMKMMYQMDAQEMNDKLKEDPNYVPTIEDDIELQRSKMVEDLVKRGTKGTPVTPETFAAWQDRKRKQREEHNRKLVQAELKKKKGGKGLAVLSGRDLYLYKKDLFDKVLDDDDDEMIMEGGEDGESVNGDADAGDDNDNDNDNNDAEENGDAKNTASSPTAENGNGGKGGGGDTKVMENSEIIDHVLAAKVQSELFLQGDDDDLDDLDDLDDD